MNLKKAWSAEYFRSNLVALVLRKVKILDLIAKLPKNIIIYFNTKNKQNLIKIDVHLKLASIEIKSILNIFRLSLSCITRFLPKLCRRWESKNYKARIDSVVQLVQQKQPLPKLFYLNSRQFLSLLLQY